MKRLLPLLLALFLVVSTPVQAQEVQFTKDDLDLSFLRHPSLQGSRRNELSGFLTQDEIGPTLDSSQKVRVVVELQSDPVIVEATKRGVKVDEMSESEVSSIQQNLLNEQASVKQELSANNIELSNTNGEDDVLADDSYTVAVNAFTTYVTVADLPEVAKLPSVKDVYYANEYERPDVVINQNNADEMVGADIAWQQYELRGEGTVVAVIDSGFDSSHKDFVLSDPTKAALTRAEVSELGLPGEYYSEKFPYAYNYYDLSSKVVDIGTGGHHGQHVAGSVAANGTVKGVAPEAQILGMKVFSDDFDYATTFSDIYLKAIEDSITLGADVLNMSLGSPAGFYVAGSIEDVALKNALENGIVSTISAGNEYNAMNNSATWANYLVTGTPYAQMKNPDIGVVGSPSLNEASLSVASIENELQTVSSLNYTIDGVTNTAPMSQATGSPNPWELLPEPVEIVRVGTGIKAHFDAVGEAVRGKVALVMRGNTFTDSLANAQAAGAVGLIVFNNTNPTNGYENLISMAGGEQAKIAYVFIGNAAGVKLDEALSAGLNPTVTFTNSSTVIENPNGRLMSAFSSWGSTPDLRMKPEITAPGGMIYSTQNNDSYGIMSGTSMAAPNAAGAAALVQQHLKSNEKFESLNLTPEARATLAKTLLMNTAVSIVDESGYDYLVRQQGAGLINIPNALETSVFVVETSTQKPKVELGSLSTGSFSTSLTLTNLSDVDVSYDVSTVLLGDYLASNKGYVLNLNSSDYLSHSLTSQNTVTVPANGSVDLPVSVSFEQYGNQYVEGFIRLTPTEGTAAVALSVPVLGFYGDWDRLPVMDELRWNLLDSDLSNDPTFTLTTLVNPTPETYYFVDSSQKIWMNPGTEDGASNGTDSVGLLATMLRNTEQANFRVLDSDGNVVRELGRHSNVRKIVRLDRSAPYTFFNNGVWDGTLDGEPVKDGDVYTYQVEFLRTLDSTPQVHNFEINIDTVMPTVENVMYDPKTYTLSFDATDSGSGLNNFVLVNAIDQRKVMVGGTAAGQYPELVAQVGQIRYVTNIKSLLSANGNSYIAILANDKAGNVGFNLTINAGPLNNVDILAGAPQVNKVTTIDSTVTGSSRAGNLVKVYMGDTELGSATANSTGQFSVSIEPQAEGTVLGVSATNEANNTESPQTKVMVVMTGLTSTGSILVDNVESTHDFSSTTFTLGTTVGVVEGSQVTFTDLETGSYKLTVENLPQGVYVGASDPVVVSSTESAFVINLTTTAPVVTPTPVKEEGPYGQGQISITTPGLLEAYDSSDVNLTGKAWGYKQITSLTVNETIDVGLTLNPQTVVNDASGVEVFYGNVYTFDQVETLNDDYYEMPFRIRSHDDVTAQTVRRFWVDTEHPTITATVLDRDSNSNTALIQLDSSDNMSVLDVYRGDDFVNSHDWTERGFNTRDITAQDLDLVQLIDGLNAIEYSVTDIAGNVTTIIVEVMKADKSILNALIRFIELMDDRSEALEEAYQAALLVSQDVMATQEEIDAAVEALYAAQASLREAPVITGATDITVYVGDEVDLRTNVTASDEQDGDLTAQLVVTPETVDTSVVGDTEVTYSVTDSTSNTTTVTVKVSVIERPVIEANKAALRMAIVIAEDTLQQETLAPAYRARLLAAVEAGRLVLDNPEATQEEVDAAAEAIRVALDPNSPVNQGPTLSGVVNVEVERNTKDVVNVLSGITAMDAQDGDLTASITADPTTIDTKTLGETVVTYTVTDSDGNVATATAVFTVVKKVEEEPTVKADTKALKDALKEAEKLDLTNVDEVLVQDLQEAMKQAQAILDAKDPTQELVDNALAALTAAITAVKDYVNPGVDTPTPGKTPKPTPETPKPETPKPETPKPETPTTVDSSEVSLSSNGVTVTGKLPSTTTLSVVKLDTKFEGYTGQAYEIKLMDGTKEVKPTSPVKVVINVNEKSKVYHVVDGKPQLHPSTMKNSSVEFTTDHFSTWLVGNPTSSSPTKNQLPSTGQETTIVLSLLSISMISTGLWIVLSKKKEA